MSHSYEMEDKYNQFTSPAQVDKEPSFIAVDAVPTSEPSSHHGTRAQSRTGISNQRRDLVLQTSSAPRSPYAPLTGQEKKLAIMHRNSVGKRSIVPILYFLAASLGKL